MSTFKLCLIVVVLGVTVVIVFLDVLKGVNRFFKGFLCKESTEDE